MGRLVLMGGGGDECEGFFSFFFFLLTELDWRRENRMNLLLRRERERTIRASLKE